MDDTWIEESALVESLNLLLSDKLWSHDQKKMYQKVNMRKVPENKLTEILEEINDFYSQFAQSFKNQFGYVSYKKFQDYIDRL